MIRSKWAWTVPAALMALGVNATPSQAAGLNLVMEFLEVGSDVVATTTGGSTNASSIAHYGISPQQPTPVGGYSPKSAGVYSATSLFGTGPAAAGNVWQVDANGLLFIPYTGVGGPGNAGISPMISAGSPISVAPSSGTGPLVVFEQTALGTGHLYLDASLYSTTNTITVNSTSTFTGQTFASLGLSTGTWIWGGGFGNIEKFTFKVTGSSGTTGGGGAVPEPGEWAAMGILGAGLTGLVIRKRRRTA